MHPFNNLDFVVSGNSLYSINPLGTVSTPLGTLSTSSGRVSMADNGLASAGIGGNQLIIVDGVAGYIYNVNTAVFSTIGGGGWPGQGGTVTFLDGYFIINNPNTMSYYVSNLYDGTTWNALATSPVSASPDPIQTVISFSQQLWIIKQNTSEVWYDAGTPTSQGSPFSRVAGAVIDYGTPAPYSVARGANTLFWLTNIRDNDLGEFVGVVQLTGYVPVVISPPAINYQINQFASVSDAFAYIYSYEGHTFYVLTFPGASVTYAYDVTTQMWHERSTYTSSPYTVSRHIGNAYAYYNGMHLLGSYIDGSIYKMSSAYYTDAGLPIVSVRTAQHISDKENLNNVFYKKLQIDVETGTGDPSIGYTQDFEAGLSWSDDGGHVWSNEYQASLGRIGQYRIRLIWRKLGYSRDRIFKLVISDPVKKVLLGAYAEAST